MYHQQGLGLAPVIAAAPAFGPAAPFVAAGGAIATGLAALFGGGDVPYDDFTREIRPIILPKAQATGRPVFVAWYGEVVGLDETGKFLKVGTYTTVEQAILIIQAVADKIGIVYGYLYDTFRMFSPQVGTTGANAPAPSPPGVTTPQLPLSYTYTPSANGGTDYIPYVIAGGLGLILLTTMKGRRKSGN
ncbi:MAG: hypothetical protein GY950_00835 [bacterium]|nr:hypothetical protein [bacterium]